MIDEQIAKAAIAFLNKTPITGAESDAMQAVKNAIVNQMHANNAQRDERAIRDLAKDPPGPRSVDDSKH